MTPSKKALILIELNEINFDVVKNYISACPTRLPAFQSLLASIGIRTTSEKRYENLEPWIQWVSVHTGKSFAEHQVFRLGDIVGSNIPQIFEILENAGYRVGAISAMNAENRLKNPAYFIPDPWTKTPTDGSWWSRIVTDALAQAVNDNAQSRLTLKSIIQLCLAFAYFARLKNYSSYMRFFALGWKQPWLRALFLDLLLHDIHFRLFKSKRPNFSTVFFNAGAHIQHHYFFSAQPIQSGSKQTNPGWYVPSGADPLGDLLELYDRILGDYLAMSEAEAIIATGLSQQPYDRMKFYYRLNDHGSFLKDLGINFLAVYPRMTRDFLVEFETVEEAALAQSTLEQVRIEADGAPFFGEIDNRGSSLFVTLTYPNEIDGSAVLVLGSRKWLAKSLVSFVAIKNGMHQAEGFAYSTANLAKLMPADRDHVRMIFSTICKFFEISEPTIR